jgi:hypothetical protein
MQDSLKGAYQKGFPKTVWPCEKKGTALVKQDEQNLGFIGVNIVSGLDLELVD